MSNPDRIIRNARHRERNRRNNPWCEPPFTGPELTDAEILTKHQENEMIVREERIIRNARLTERMRRNNPWSEPACTDPRRTDAQILAFHRATETREERIQRRLNPS